MLLKNSTSLCCDTIFDWKKKEGKILCENENKSFSSRRREQVGNFFFIIFFSATCYVHNVAKKRRKIFKYKANEIENFIAVYKKACT